MKAVIPNRDTRRAAEKSNNLMRCMGFSSLVKNTGPFRLSQCTIPQGVSGLAETEFRLRILKLGKVVRVIQPLINGWSARGSPYAPAESFLFACPGDGQRRLGSTVSSGKRRLLLFLGHTFFSFGKEISYVVGKLQR